MMFRLDSVHFIIHTVIFVIVYFFLLTIAECIHALVAYWCGDETPKLSGKLSLDPFQHVDFIGTLSLCLLGIGWSKNSPLNLENIKNPYRFLKIGAIFAAPLLIYLTISVVSFITILKIYGYEMLQIPANISSISKLYPHLTSLSLVLSLILISIVHIAIMLIAVRLIYTFLDFLTTKFFNYYSIDAFLFSIISLFIALTFINPLMQRIGYLVGSIVYLIV